MTEHTPQQAHIEQILDQTKSHLSLILYPLIAFIITIAITSWLAITIEKHQKQRIQTLVSNKAHMLSTLIHILYQDRLTSLHHYISDWKQLEDLPPKELQQRAKQLLTEIPSFKLVSLIERPSRIKWTVHNIKSQPKDQINQAINTYQKLWETQELSLLSSSTTLNQNNKGVFIFIPYKDKQIDGLMVVFWNISHALNEFLKTNGYSKRFNISLSINKKLVFQNHAVTTQGKNTYRSTKTIQLLNQKIKFELVPTTLWIDENETSMPYLILLCGFLYALLLSYILFALENLKWNSLKNKIIRHSLESEMADKITAENKLQGLNFTFNLATSSGGIGVWNWDLKTDKLYWSEKMFSLFGIPKDVQPVYTTWRNAVLEEDIAPTETLLKEALDGLHVFNTIFRIKHPELDVRYIKATGWVRRDSGGLPIKFIGINLDVTDSIKIDKIMSTLQLGAYELDVTQSTLSFNDDFAIKMGYEKQQFTKIDMDSWVSFIHQDDRANYQLLINSFIKNESNFYESEYRIKNKSDQWVWVNDRAAILSNEYDHKPKCILGVLADISVRKTDEENFRFQAEHDALTNLTSRRLALNSLQLSIKRAKRTKEPLALLMIDIDDFKSINDRFGHMMGDMVLKEFANRLTYYFRESDMVSRISGDEFLIILYQADSLVTHALVENLCTSLTEPYFFEAEKIHVSASIGVSFFPDDDQHPNQLIKKADEAMYFSKKSGKNKICYWKDHFANEKKT